MLLPEILRSPIARSLVPRCAAPRRTVGSPRASFRAPRMRRVERAQLGAPLVAQHDRVHQRARTGDDRRAATGAAQDLDRSPTTGLEIHFVGHARVAPRRPSAPATPTAAASQGARRPYQLRSAGPRRARGSLRLSAVSDRASAWDCSEKTGSLPEVPWLRGCRGLTPGRASLDFNQRQRAFLGDRPAGVSWGRDSRCRVGDRPILLRAGAILSFLAPAS